MPVRQGDFYELLGVGRDASAAAIKRAYHTAARRFHPDRNLRPGETEMFLDIQRAYEVLSDEKRRAQYDATLPLEETGPQPLKCAIQYSRQQLAPLDEPQLIYALLEIESTTAGMDLATRPLNLCLVLDRSTSMQGTKLELAKRAATRIVQAVGPRDLFSVVAFADKAEVLVSNALKNDPRQAQSRIQSLHTAGGTEIYRGLEAGMQELRRGLVSGHHNHLILLTDGHTYGDEPACMILADDAAALNIGISAMGIGSDWNDGFVDQLASRTGGSSIYISKAADIEDLLFEKFRALKHALMDDVVVYTHPVDGVRQMDIFRTQPEGGPLEVRERLHLGPILDGNPLQVLIEFRIEPSATKGAEATLLDGAIETVVADQGSSLPPMRLRLQVPVKVGVRESSPPASLMTALARLSLYRLQERARQETRSGQFEAATRHLRHLAARLEDQGQHELSKTAILEARRLEETHALSGEGEKQIKYGTRALLLPPPEGAA
jgi:Ca-activated chloride channel family protein